MFCPGGIPLRQLWRLLQNPNQVAVRIQCVLLGCLNQTVDHRAGLCTGRRVGKQPVLPSHHKRLYAALGTVVAQLQTAIFQILYQIRPLFQQIMQRLAQCGDFPAVLGISSFAHANRSSRTGFSCSSRLYSSTNPLPSQYRAFTLSRRLPQKRNSVLVNGSRRNCCCTIPARPSMPRRRSV